MNSIIDAETMQAREGIQARAEMIKKGMIDRDGQEFNPEKFISDVIGS